MPTSHKRVLAPSRLSGPTCGSSDCIIVAKERPSQKGPRILQVIESLSYRPEERTVVILIDIISEHDCDVPVRYRVVHRGGVAGVLRRFLLHDEDPRQRILTQLYAKRMTQHPTDEDLILFHPRTNCMGYQREGVEVSLAGPGRCFDQLPVESQLRPEHGVISPDGSPPVFTSFLIPPEGTPAICGEERSICRLELRIHPQTYDHLVGTAGGFSVDSYDGLVRDIEYDLQVMGTDDLKDFFCRAIKPAKALLLPKAYDIVVFQEIGQRIEVDSGSISICPAPESEIGTELRDKVLWFFGQTEEFYLSLRYQSDPLRGRDTLAEARARP